MAALGLPVPPAFVLPIELCAAIANGEPGAKKKLADGLDEGIAFLERVTGKAFGDRRRPLLVSVRSGAARSMPGMLDTVLDVGCTPGAVRGLIRATANPHFAHRLPPAFSRKLWQRRSRHRAGDICRAAQGPARRRRRDAGTGFGLRGSGTARCDLSADGRGSAGRFPPTIRAKISGPRPRRSICPG